MFLCYRETGSHASAGLRPTHSLEPALKLAAVNREPHLVELDAALANA